VSVAVADTLSRAGAAANGSTATKELTILVPSQDALRLDPTDDEENSVTGTLLRFKVTTPAGGATVTATAAVASAYGAVRVVRVSIRVVPEVAESVKYRRAAGAPADFDTKDTVNVSEMPSSSADTESVAAVVESDMELSAELVEVPLATPVIDKADTVADDGATDITPRPNAATATSATRLNVVFVDICFLSIVELRTIRGSALELVS
jgi:hypothetical protein